MFIALLFCLVGNVWHCDYLVGKEGDDCFASRRFVMCVLSVCLCLLFFLASLVGYVLWLWLVRFAILGIKWFIIWPYILCVCVCVCFISAFTSLWVKKSADDILKYFFSLRKRAYSNILNILPPKNENFQIKKIWYFPYFCSKHRLWVLIRTASTRRF